MENKKASDFIAKSIFTLDGSYQGYILNNIFDKDFNKLIGFKVVDDNDETEKFLPIENIRLFGKDCIFAKTLTENFDFVQHNSPMGKQVFDEKGNSLGQVSEIFLIGRRIKSVKVHENEILASKIHFIGKNCIILNKKTQKNIFSNIRSELTGNEPKIEIQTNNAGFNYAKIGQKINPPISISSPKKIILNPPSIVGKIASEDIFGLNNELIIKKGQIISQQKIDVAKKHGKLNLLIINAK